MAFAPVFSFRPPGFLACAAPGDSRSSKKAASGGSWWSPLFGWPAEPDYIGGSEGGTPEAARSEKNNASEKRRGGRRFASFTEEKARRLRILTARTSTFHDEMYHSAIAARLASEFPDGPGS